MAPPEVPASDPVTVGTVDLLLTAAVQWQERIGDSEGFRYPCFSSRDGATVRLLTTEGADRMGRLLLAALELPAAEAYTFQALPGAAAPEVVLGCVHAYSYAALARGRFKGRETGWFVQALDRAAAGQLAERAPEVPWGLEEVDRDIFVRFEREHRGWARRGGDRRE